ERLDRPRARPRGDAGFTRGDFTAGPGGGARVARGNQGSSRGSRGHTRRSLRRADRSGGLPHRDRRRPFGGNGRSGGRPRVLPRGGLRRHRPRAGAGAAPGDDPGIRGRHAPAAGGGARGAAGRPGQRTGRAREDSLLREEGRPRAGADPVMPFLRASRAKLVWALELALGLELYACAVLALHARGLSATPLLASAGLVIPALVIPPVFYVLVGLVSVRPLSLWRVLVATGAMCGVHTVLVMATGALFVIPDLVDYGAAVVFSLWGSPAVTLLQLTAAPRVLARLRPLIVQPRPGVRGATGRRVDALGNASASTVREPVVPASTPSRASSAAAPRPAAGTPLVTAAVAAQPTANAPAATSSRPAPVVREPAVAASTAAPRVAPRVISAEASPFRISAPVVRA